LCFHYFQHFTFSLLFPPFFFLKMYAAQRFVVLLSLVPASLAQSVAVSLFPTYVIHAVRLLAHYCSHHSALSADDVEQCCHQDWDSHVAFLLPSSIDVVA
jgi:hypothetical protein